VTEVCELPLLGAIMGRLLFAEDATNLFVGWTFFFAGEGVVAAL
jgi:hypothetical protein